MRVGGYDAKVPLRRVRQTAFAWYRKEGLSQSTIPWGFIGKSDMVRQVRKRPSKSSPRRVDLVAIALFLYVPALTFATPCDLANSFAVPFVIRYLSDVTELAEAVNCSGGSFSAIWMQHVEMSETISIFGGTSLSITGSGGGDPVIDGGHKIQLFSVHNGSLDVSNVTITNAVGSAIEAAHSVITTRNCTFSNNTAAEGGGIYLEGSRMEVFDTIFSNNTGRGGAIAAFNSTVVLSNHVLFAKNNASYGKRGGALFAHGSNVSVYGNTTFTLNNAECGGASFMTSGHFIVDGHVAFWGNQALVSGGGLYGSQLSVRIDGDGTWDTNEARSGGGVFLFLSDLVATSSNTFLNNEGWEFGGALYLLNSSLDITQSTFTNNSASVLGGAIVAGNATINIDGNVTFSRNRGYGQDNGWGGGIFGQDTSVNIYGQARFTDNVATDGAGAFLIRGNLTVDGHVLFANNSAVHSAGGLYGKGLSAEVRGTVEWRRNSAVFGGGLFCFLYCNITILGAVAFAENDADMGGGAWLSGSSSLKALEYVEFVSNTARDGAGVVLFDALSRFMGESLFDDNAAAKIGGGILLFGDSELSMSGRSTFSANSGISGGAVALRGGTRGNLSGDILMVGNSASSSGGAIYAEAPERIDGLTLEGVRFVSNHAETDGGAVTLLSAGDQSSNSKVVDCEFLGNEAADAGGALFIAGGFVQVSGIEFSHNVAGRTGGAILASGVVDVKECQFYENHAQVGPAIANTVSVTVNSSAFVNNTLLCDDTAFLNWANESAYLVACNECSECSLCEVANPDRVQTCEPLLEHTTSEDPCGDLKSLRVDEGFWRESPTSREILECYEASACSGGVLDYCAGGYEGPYCAVCSEGYASGLSYTCSECSEERRNVTIIAVVVALLVILITALTCFDILQRVARSSGTRRESLVVDGLLLRSKKARVFQALKTVIVSWQIISQFSTVATVTYPDVYQRFLQYIEFITLDLGWVFSAGCLIDTCFYDELLIMTIAPLGVCSLIAASYARVLCRGSPQSDSEGMATSKRLHASLLFWTSFLVYSTASATLFQTFACDTLESGVSYLRVDHQLECYTPAHRFFMVYASLMIVVYPVGIPLWYSMVLYRNRDHVRGDNCQTEGYHLLFKDLWQPYRSEVFYYEVVECARRVILAGVVVFIIPNTAGQVAISFLMALAFLCVLLTLSPYENPWNDWLARISHAVVMMSMFVALMMKVDATGDDSTSQRVFGGALVALNLVMIVAVVVEAFGMCFITVREIDLPVPCSKVDETVDIGVYPDVIEAKFAPGPIDETLGESSVGKSTVFDTEHAKWTVEDTTSGADDLASETEDVRTLMAITEESRPEEEQVEAELAPGLIFDETSVRSTVFDTEYAKWTVEDITRGPDDVAFETEHPRTFVAITEEARPEEEARPASE